MYRRTHYSRAPDSSSGSANSSLSTIPSVAAKRPLQRSVSIGESTHDHSRVDNTTALNMVGQGVSKLDTAFVTCAYDLYIKSSSHSRNEYCYSASSDPVKSISFSSSSLSTRTKDGSINAATMDGLIDQLITNSSGKRLAEIITIVAQIKIA